MTAQGQDHATQLFVTIFYAWHTILGVGGQTLLPQKQSPSFYSFLFQIILNGLEVGQFNWLSKFWEVTFPKDKISNQVIY